MNRRKWDKTKDHLRTYSAAFFWTHAGMFSIANADGMHGYSLWTFGLGMVLSIGLYKVFRNLQRMDEREARDRELMEDDVYEEG